MLATLIQNATPINKAAKATHILVVLPKSNKLPKKSDFPGGEVLATLLADNVQARELKPDGSYERLKPKDRKRRDAQMLFQRTGQRR